MDLIIGCHTSNMTMKGERYYAAILEDLNSKFDLLIERVQHINNTTASKADIALLGDKIDSLDNSTRALLVNHTTRIQKLELALKPL